MMRRTVEGTSPRRLDDRWIANFSSRMLSATEKEALARGLNFLPARERIPITEIITVVKNGLRSTDQSEAQLARSRIVGCLNKARSPTSAQLNTRPSST